MQNRCLAKGILKGASMRFLNITLPNLFPFILPTEGRKTLDF